MMQHHIKLYFQFIIIWLCSSLNVNAQTDDMRPNIILILAEDLSPRVGFAGDRLANTPTLDALAKESLVFNNAFTAAGVCAPSRSALIMGAHMQTLGTMHMRTSSADRLYGPGHNYQAVPPAEVKAFPELLRAAGYYTSNNAKTDYQIGNPFTIWDESSNKAHWRNRPDGKPFFHMIMHPYTHEAHTWPPSMNSGVEQHQSQYKRNEELDAMKTHFTDRSKIVVPPYYPDTIKVRETIARQYDNVNVIDGLFAEVIEQLKKDGLMENTIIIWSTDHGDGLPRAKRSLYDSGIKVPMFIRFPDGYGKGETTDELISFVDLAPTILNWAGADIPKYMQGHIAIGPNKEKEAEYIYAAADRFDEKHSRYKAVRSKKYKYIRNYRTDIPFYQHLDYRDHQPIMEDLWQGFEKGTLTDQQASLFKPGPAEELYDLEKDPYEIKNLAGDQEYETVLDEYRKAMDDWIKETGDLTELHELDLIEKMWPGHKQPITAPVEFKTLNDKVSLLSPTEGASIGYRVLGQEEWKLYSTPLDGTKNVEAKAIRYGYQESVVSTK